MAYNEIPCDSPFSLYTHTRERERELERELEASRPCDAHAIANQSFIWRELHVLLIY